MIKNFKLFLESKKKKKKKRSKDIVYTKRPYLWNIYPYSSQSSMGQDNLDCADCGSSDFGGGDFGGDGGGGD